MNHQAILSRYLILISAVWTLTGCAYDYAAEASFGQSVSQAIARQSVNPAGTPHDGVAPGLDGVAAKASIDRYQSSFERPAGLGDVLSIGVGHSSGSEANSTNTTVAK